MTSTQKSLRKIQRKWEKQCAKDPSVAKRGAHQESAPAPAKHGVMVQISSQALVNKISKLNASNGLEDSPSD